MRTRHAAWLLLLVPAVFAQCHRRPRNRPVAYPEATADAGVPAATFVNTAATQPAPTGTWVGGPGPTGPVTDADRRAARDLFNEGVALQRDKPAEALDRFTRSYSVFPAPTTALRIAQCNVVIGKLVEAAEGYRALANANIPAGSPPAFFEAQKTAAGEVATVEARIPKVRITFTPPYIQGLTITVDGQPFNAALVGVHRPTDPGNHVLMAVAPGYYQVVLSFDVKEKEQKDVPVPMKRR